MTTPSGLTVCEARGPAQELRLLRCTNSSSTTAVAWASVVARWVQPLPPPHPCVSPLLPAWSPATSASAWSMCPWPPAVWDGSPLVFLFKGQRPQRQQPMASGERRWIQRVGLPQPSLSSVLPWQPTGSTADVLQPAVSAEHRVWASLRPAVPRNSCQSHVRPGVCSGGGSPERGATQGGPGTAHLCPWSEPCPGCLLSVLPATRLARADGPVPVLIILFLAHSGCFWAQLL